MIVSALLCWLGVGSLALANPKRLERVLGRRAPSAATWVLRAFGLGALLASVWIMRTELDGALALVSALIALMVASSIAALLAPLRPRLYASSMPLALIAASYCWFAG